MKAIPCYDLKNVYFQYLACLNKFTILYIMIKNIDTFL